MASKSEGETLFLVLCIFAFLAVVVGLLIWKNRSLFGLGGKSFMMMNTFTPPPGRQAYIEARQKLDPSKPEEMNELRKLLMGRALQTIPIIRNLQNESSSVDRLYRKGMLTDDLHALLKEHKDFLDEEIVEVQYEANELNPGWDKHIWPQAMQYHQMLVKKNEEQVAAAEASAEQKKMLEKEKRKEKTAKTAMETQTAMKVVQETPEQRADRLAKELIEEEEREQNKLSKNSKKKK